MTRRTYRYDHDLGEVIEVTRGSNYYEPTPQGPNIIRDIEPYRAVASDVACGGKRPMIGSRSRHREFLSRNGYVETGNDVPMSGNRPTMTQADRIADIKRALGE